MSQTSRNGRRSGQRRNQQEREEQVIARKRKRRNLVFSVLVLGIALFLLVMVTPKEVQRRASYSTGTEDGLVEEQGKASSIYEGLLISELMSSNHTAVPDDHGAYSDWIEVWNSSDHDIPLEGVGLSDDGNAIRFLFQGIS